MSAPRVGNWIHGALLFVTAAAGVGPVAQAQEPAPGGRIVLLFDNGIPAIDCRIAAVSPRDKKLRPLMEQLDFRFQPNPHGLVVTRDGKKAAYLADGTAPPGGGRVTFKLFIRSLDDPTAVGENLGVPADSLIAWSTDGHRVLLMTATDADTYEHRVLDVQQQSMSLVSLPKGEKPAEATSFVEHRITDWSPDGQWFLTFCWWGLPGKESGSHLYKVKADGSEAVRLKHVDYGLAARFSPDGKRILYVGHHREGGKEYRALFVTDLAGGPSRRVSRELDGVVLPGCWSPDGRKIAYVWWNGRSGQSDEAETFLMVADANGESSEVVVSHKAVSTWRFNSLNWR